MEMNKVFCRRRILGTIGRSVFLKSEVLMKNVQKGVEVK